MGLDGVTALCDGCGDRHWKGDLKAVAFDDGRTWQFCPACLESECVNIGGVWYPGEITLPVDMAT